MSGMITKLKVQFRAFEFGVSRIAPIAYSKTQDPNNAKTTNLAH